MPKQKPEPTEEALYKRILGCLVAATADRETARACRERLESMSSDGDEMVTLFARLGDMTNSQVDVMRGWPLAQIRLLKAVAIEACRMVEGAVPLKCRGFARAGLPRAISITLTDDNYLDITFVGPELV